MDVDPTSILEADKVNNLPKREFQEPKKSERKLEGIPKQINWREVRLLIPIMVNQSEADSC